MLSFEVKKLFGKFNYKFKLKESGITILTGPNGFGKTTILKCLEAFTDINKIEYFGKLEFKEIKIIINKEISFVLLKKKDDIQLKYNKSEPLNLKVLIKYHNYYYNDEIRQKRRERTYIIRKHYDYFIEKTEKIEKNYERLKNILSEIQNIEKIYYIKDDRLFNKQYIEYNNTDRYDENDYEYNSNEYNNNDEYSIINSIPKRLKAIIDKFINEYYNNSNQLDSTYTKRLFRNKEEISNKEYQNKRNDMNKKLSILYKYGLFSNKKEEINFKFEKKYAGALKVYFDDFEKKYNIYKELIKKLDTFTNIVNNKLYYKKIKISKEYGIQIFSDNYNEIKLSDLSSGEKQEIILFFELIFSTDKSLMILIDEPELSLHVAWQKKFIDDLFNIIKNKKINVIIATHSPYIIGGYEENQIDLGELYKNAK